MKKLMLTVTGLAVIFIGCHNEKRNHSLADSVQEKQVSLNAQAPLPDLSVYHLPAVWTNEDNKEIKLEELRGKVLVTVMIYTSCKAACPRLVADMRNIEKQFSDKDLEKLKFIMVSIDPETDTPKRLKQFSIDNEMVDEHWMFLRGTPEDTREFAAVLAVSYKRISPLDFTHSNIISVFDKEGVLVHQQEGLGMDNDQTVTAIKGAVSKDQN